MRSMRLPLIVLLPLALATVLEAVPRLGPPTEYLQSDDRYRSAVVKVAERTADGRYRLEVVERLKGETPDGLVVRTVGGDQGLIAVGATYIVAHTDKPARRSYRYTTDPAGSRILGVPAVGLAVFENSDAMRTLVRSRPADQPLTDRRRLEAVLAQLQRPDVQSRRFVLAELALDGELRALVGDEELGLLKTILASGELEPLAHEYLLRAALPMVESWGGEWLAEDSRRVVAAHGTKLELASLIPSLLVVALETLETTGAAEDAELARRHVASNNPGVGKAAFDALVALDRELAIEVAPSYAESGSLHPDTRRRVLQFTARADAESGPGQP